jgi:PHD/YefM family antitoxin component YafN of YafNO toxin-antitoxin module
VEYLVNEKGERTRVVLSVEEYEELLEAREELEDIAAHNEAVEAIRNGEETVPWEVAQMKIGSEHESSHSP